MTFSDTKPCWEIFVMRKWPFSLALPCFNLGSFLQTNFLVKSTLLTTSFGWAPEFPSTSHHCSLPAPGFFVNPSTKAMLSCSSATELNLPSQNPNNSFILPAKSFSPLQKRSCLVLQTVRSPTCAPGSWHQQCCMEMYCLPSSVSIHKLIKVHVTPGRYKTLFEC